MSYFVIILWRVCESVARFSIFTLLWSVVGGVYLVLYLVIDSAFYILLARFSSLLMLPAVPGQKWDGLFHINILFALQSVVGIPLRPKPSVMVIRFLDSILVLGAVIAVFALVEFDCPFCTDPYQRSASNNPYVRILLIAALCSVVLQPVIFAGLWCGGYLSDQRQPYLVKFPPSIKSTMKNVSETEKKTLSAHPALWNGFLARQAALANEEMTEAPTVTPRLEVCLEPFTEEELANTAR